VTGVSVCLSVCTHMSGTTRPNFTKFSVRGAGGHSSVLVWRHALCISGFVDDIVFPVSYTLGPMTA